MELENIAMKVEDIIVGSADDLMIEDYVINMSHVNDYERLFVKFKRFGHNLCFLDLCYPTFRAELEGEYPDAVNWDELEAFGNWERRAKVVELLNKKYKGEKLKIVI